MKTNKPAPGHSIRISLLFALLLPLMLMTGCDNQPDTSEALSHVNRAETYAQQGLYRSAILEMRNAIEKDPDNVTHVVTLAQMYNRIGGFRQAADLLSPWLQEQPDQVAIPLANAYLEQGKHLSAKETLELYSPDSAAEEQEKASLVAYSKRLAGETSEAIGDFRTVLEANPDQKTASTGLAEALLATNDPKAAIGILDKWMERNGKDADALYLKGLAHYRLGDAEQSTATLTDATSVVPSSDVFLPVRRKILALLSRSLTEQGRITEAQVYNRILAENTNSDALERAELAIEAINRGETDAARDTLEDLMRQNPENEQVALLLGALKLLIGERDEGESLLVENIDAETTPTPFIRALTTARIDSGKREEALKTLSRAIEARPNDPDLLAMHGLLALSLPEHQASGVESLSKALELDRSRSRLRLALAQHFMSQGQPEQALTQMRVAFTETPMDWSVTQTYLALLLRTGGHSEAQEVKESLLKDFSNEPVAVTLAAITEHRLGDTEQARKRLENQVKSSSDNAMALMALASVYNDQGKADEAAETLRKAAVQRPNNVNLLQKASQLYASNHSLEEVLDWLLQIKADHPDLAPNSLSLAARIRLQQGQLQAARNLLSEIPADAQNEFSQAVTGQILVAEAESAARNQEWEKARSKAAEAISLQPDNLRFALVPISLFAQEGNFQGALDSLDKLQETYGQVPEIVLTRARLLTATEGNGAAWDFLESRWNETREAELLPRLIALAELQSPSSLDELTGAWVDAQPGNPAAIFTRAEFQLKSGNSSGAIESYESAIAMKPDNPIALNNLAWLLREQDQERAITLSSRAQELAPENPQVLDTYGWILHLAGRHQEALPIIERALTLRPDSEEIRQHLESVKKSL